MKIHGSRKTIFDISSIIEYLSHHPHYSGIQRVVAMILSEYQKLEGSNKDIWLSFLHPSRKEHLAINLNQFNDNIFTSPENVRDFFQQLGVIPKGPHHLLNKYFNNKIKYYFHRTRYDIASLFKHQKTFNKRGLTSNDWKTVRKTPVSLPLSIKQLNEIVAPKDQFVLLDSTWEKRHIKAFKAAKSLDLTVFTLVYDLIPILVPGVAQNGVIEAFGRWIIQSTEYTDFYMAISKYTAEETVSYLNQYKRNLTVDVLPLTQTRVPITPFESKKRFDEDDFTPLPTELQMFEGVSELCRSLLNDKFVLHVGTIEIRKNTWRLALAWKKLLDEGHTDLPRLVFAGRRGWMNERFFDLLQATGNLYGYVTIIDRVSDAELELLYKHCLFASMVSTYEGWGLPVGEALSYGKTAVVSNTTSLPEVGMDLVEYCDPLSVDSIADAARRLIYEPEHRESLEKRIKMTRLRDWADVAHDLKHILDTNQQ